MLDELLNKLIEKYGDDFNWGITNDDYFLDELNKELSVDHPLYHKADKTVARCYSNDDVLFMLDDLSYAINHLTYSKTNINGYPRYRCFPNAASVIEYIEKEYIAEFL